MKTANTSFKYTSVRAAMNGFCDIFTNEPLSTERKRSHRWLTGSMRLGLLQIVEGDFLGCTYVPSSSLSVVLLDFTETLCPSGLETMPISEFTQTLREKEDVRGIGNHRIDALAQEVRTNPHMRIVSATFPYHGFTLRVIARFRITLIGGSVTLVSGFDFIQKITSPSPFPLGPDLEGPLSHD